MQLFQMPLDLHSYLILGGVAVVILALVFYFLPLRRIKLPAILATGLGALALGVGLGMAAMVSLGYHWNRETPYVGGSAGGAGAGEGAGAAAKGGAKGGGAGMNTMAMMKEGMKKGGGGKGGGGGGRGPSAKSQLTSLVAKLDLLTNKALVVDLTKEEKARVAEQLKGLEQSKELRDEEAKRRLDSLLDALKSHKETFEAAGYRWPGQTGGGAGPAAEPPNPFQEEKNAQHLKSLQGKL